MINAARRASVRSARLPGSRHFVVATIGQRNAKASTVISDEFTLLDATGKIAPTHSATDVFDTGQML